MEAKEIIQALTEIQAKAEAMTDFLNDLWYRCGSNHTVNKKELVEFFATPDPKTHKTKWVKLRGILRPNFDDSE